MTKCAKFLFINLSLLLTFCLSASVLLAEKKPKWVIQRPISNEYYVGIGVASKVGTQADYTEKAKGNALKDLASQIAVHISAKTMKIATERHGLFEDEIKSVIQSHTSTELTGHELIDTWEDDNQYWVFYRLSKAEHLKARLREIEQAKQLALNRFQNGQAEIANGDLGDGLSLLIDALITLEPYVGENLDVELDGKSVYLWDAIHAELQETLDNTRLIAPKTTPAIKHSEAIKPIGITIEYTKDTTPIRVQNLPIQGNFIVGNGTFKDMSRSDVNGVARLFLADISMQPKTQIIKVMPDLFALNAEHDSTSQIDKLLQRMRLPEQRVVVEVIAPKIHIALKEFHLNEPASPTVLKPYASEYFASSGFETIDDLGAADYSIKMNAKSRQGTEIYDMFTVMVDLSIEVLNLGNGETIYSTNVNNINGVGLNYEQGNVKAYEKAGNRLKAEILPKVLKRFEEGNMAGK